MQLALLSLLACLALAGVVLVKQCKDVLGVEVGLLNMALGSCLFNLVVKDAFALFVRHVECVLDNVVAKLVFEKLHH